MATVGIAFALQESPPILAQPDLALGPQANATPAQDPSQQDVVTLMGRTAENGQTRTGNDNAQFGEAAAFFFAERQSFRAANGSAGSQTAQAPRVPELPAKLTTGAPAQQNAAPNSVDSAQQPEAPAANAAPQGAALSIAANLETNSATGAAPSPTAGPSDTPLAELAQLDRTLQQIGIDPQSISLFSRMAMLLYANDPAALKILVQTLQSGAQQLGTGSNAETANTNPAGTDVQNPVSAQAQTSNAPPNQGANTSEVQASVAQLARQAQVAVAAETQQDQRTSVPSGTESTGTITSNSGIPTPSQRLNFPSRLGDLSVAFAAVGLAQFVSGSQNTQPGQLLNVTF